MWIVTGNALSFLAGVSGGPPGQQSESPFYLLGKVVMQQSYVCALIAMMVTNRILILCCISVYIYIYIHEVIPALTWCSLVVQVWSITYHSWLTFVLLLWACLIWILRARYSEHLWNWSMISLSDELVMPLLLCEFLTSLHIHKKSWCVFVYSTPCVFLQTARSHSVLSIHPALWPGSVLPAVYLGHGSAAWASHHSGNHEPQTTRPGQSSVSLSETRSYGTLRA